MSSFDDYRDERLADPEVRAAYLAREIRKAKAEGWQRCVEWFTASGPFQDSPWIPGWVISKAEEANPYDIAYTAPLNKEIP